MAPCEHRLDDVDPPGLAPPDTDKAMQSPIQEAQGSTDRVPRRWAVIGQACLTVACLWLAERILAEPFVLVRKSEVWTLVALPAFLACLQAQLALVFIFSIVRRRKRRFRAALLVAWSILSLWFLVFVPRAYVDDIAKFQAFRSSHSNPAR